METMDDKYIESTIDNEHWHFEQYKLYLNAIIDLAKYERLLV